VNEKSGWGEERIWDGSESPITPASEGRFKIVFQVF
jgi:hypothetical protein